MYRFLGDSYTFYSSFGWSIQLEKDKAYDVQVAYEGPQVIVNGQQMLADGPNVNYWIIFDKEKDYRIPYSPQAFKRDWKQE